VQPKTCFDRETASVAFVVFKSCDSSKHKTQSTQLAETDGPEADVLIQLRDGKYAAQIYRMIRTLPTHRYRTAYVDTVTAAGYFTRH